MHNKRSLSSSGVVHGCDRAGISCGREAQCFTPHPWSPTHETCYYASAFMRAEHAAYELLRSVKGEPSYREAIEILMKGNLIARTRTRL